MDGVNVFTALNMFNANLCQKMATVKLSMSNTSQWIVTEQLMKKLLKEKKQLKNVNKHQLSAKMLFPLQSASLTDRLTCAHNKPCQSTEQQLICLCLRLDITDLDQY